MSGLHLAAEAKAGGVGLDIELLLSWVLTPTATTPEAIGAQAAAGIWYH